jgi:hypothetical protein
MAMRKQKSVVIKPTPNPDNSLGISELDTLQEQGWTVNSMAESGNYCILVILDAPHDDGN